MNAIEILLAHKNEEIRKELREILTTLGHEVVAEVSTGPELRQAALDLKPRLIVSSFNLDPGAAIDVLIGINEVKPTPTIIIAMKENLDQVEKAMEDHVMAYLIDPVTRDDLNPTILVVLRRFDEMEALRAEVDSLKESLANRKKLERAKGILMASKDFTEEEAYLHIRDMATKRGMKLNAVAEMIIEISK